MEDEIQEKMDNKEQPKAEINDSPAEDDQEDKFHDCEEIAETIERKADNESDKEFEEPSKDFDSEILRDDFVDEDEMKQVEKTLNEEQLKERFEDAKNLKEQGNEEFKEENFEESIRSYTKALLTCPLIERDLRAILYSNRAAAKIKYGAKESAIMDCTKSLEYKDNYMKSLIRRAKLYEEMDKLDEALDDYKKIYELDRSNKEALYATQTLPPKIHERNEKLKSEMMDKLKDLGNMVLRPFGLSTNNFQLQPTDSGGYTINFQQ